MDRDTRIEAGVWIGQFVVVGHGVTIRRNSLIEDYVGIGAGTVVGEGVVVASRSWIGLGATVDMAL